MINNRADLGVNVIMEGTLKTILIANFEESWENLYQLKF